jgi:hypothetical protein
MRPSENQKDDYDSVYEHCQENQKDDHDSVYEHCQENQKDEYNSLQERETWKLVPTENVPAKYNVLSRKWIFKSDGRAVRGFQQKYGIDYHETFATVARNSSYRLVLALIELGVFQFDIKTAFLYGNLDETVGFEITGYVCHLRKSIYALKQASRAWAKRLQTSLQHHGFKELTSDPCIYFKTTTAGLTLIAIYIDIH